MYARHARMFGVQEYLLCSHSPLPAFLLQDRLTPIDPLLTPMETADKPALVAAVNMSCQQDQPASARARGPAWGDGSV